MFDETQFQELFSVYYIPLCMYAKKHGMQQAESEDIVQEIFVRLWQKRNELNISTSVQAYMYQSVHNECINFLKRKIVLNQNNSEFEIKLKRAELFYAISEEDGSSALLYHELEDKVKQAIRKLPEQCRQIFILSRIENLSVKEIASKLDLSTNTVQRQISIAIAKIRELLKPYLSDTIITVLFFSEIF